jgi:uncharacterized protein YndB with AHSA1/START domain
MKTYIYETKTAVSPETLFRAITAIDRWPEWDGDLEYTAHDGNLDAGARFMLKPRGGPRVAMTIVEAISPSSFVDIAHMPLGVMRTSHRFILEQGGTRLRLVIDVSGILGFLWDRVVARKQAAGAAAQTEKLIAFAQRLTR